MKRRKSRRWIAHQPGLPLKKGRSCWKHDFHDYKRHGTTTLFGGIGNGGGQASSEPVCRGTGIRSGIKFLELIDQETPGELDLHLIADNYSTHKHPEGRALAETPSPVPHALHSHEQFVVELDRTLVPGRITDKRIRREAFTKRAATDRRPSTTSSTITTKTPNPFIWRTAPVQDIPRKSPSRPGAVLDKTASA